MYMYLKHLFSLNALKKLYISLEYNVKIKAVVLFAYEFDFHTYTKCNFSYFAVDVPHGDCVTFIVRETFH